MTTPTRTPSASTQPTARLAILFPASNFPTTRLENLGPTAMAAGSRGCLPTPTSNHLAARPDNLGPTAMTATPGTKPIAVFSPCPETTRPHTPTTSGRPS